MAQNFWIVSKLFFIPSSLSRTIGIFTSGQLSTYGVIWSVESEEVLEVALRHELHKDVGGLLLGHDADQPHHVVALERPATHTHGKHVHG